MLENTEYRQMLMNGSFGYAHHKIILNENNKPCDYEFLEVNKAFEEMTGLKAENIINRKISSVIPELNNDDFDWISFYGEIALNGGQKEFSQCTKHLKRHYKIQVFSHKKMFFTCIFTDISAEKALFEELEGFFNVNLDLLCVADTEGNFVKVNPAWTHTLGYETEELLNRKFLELIHPEDLEETIKAISKLEKQENLLNFVNRYRHKDGSYRYIEWRSHPKGNLIYAAARDITEHIEKEEELEKSEKRLKGILESQKNLIVRVDTENRFTFVNKLYCETFGKSHNELINKSFTPLIHAEDLAETMKIMEKIYHPPHRVYLEQRAMTIHGWRWFAWEDNAILDDNGKVIEIQGVGLDITERKEAEEILRKSEEKFRTLFELYPDGIILIDTETALPVQFNRIAHEQLGYTEEEFFKIKISDYEALEKPEETQAHIRKIITEGRDDFETRHRCKNGDLIDVSVTVINIVLNNKNFFLCLNRNITKAKNLERELIEAKEQALSASKAKSEFLANMSHEIRTPMNSIIGFGELLAKTELKPVQNQYVENINNAGNSLLGVINDILDFSKVEAGKLELDIQSSDLIELIENTADVVKYQAGQKKLELLLNISPQMPRFALVDPARLGQILVNLLSNAVKFTEKGEVELKIDFSAINEKQGKFYFQVRDTGIGINEEQQKRLFKAFSQADSSTTRKFGGTGLGLTIANMLAEKMGGKIELESKANEGSRFFFSIETDYQNGEKIPNGSLGMIKRILVIDDNDNNRLILEQLLKSWNIEFTGTDNGLSALKIINTSPAFDVIIVDYNMPYLNGMDTIKMIRDKLDLSPEKMPVILLYSSSEDAEIHEKCRELGIKFQLTKPVKTSQLMNLLKRIHNPAQSASETEKSGTETQRIKPDNAEKIRVLIAEDIPTNMALAEIVIRSVLPEAIIIKAENGLKTLEAYREQQPQIIFMDVQMPVMDGLLATEKIREIEQETKIRVPIIALTAGALKEEEQKCHEAGMDDFMTKPFKQQLVREILEKHLNIQT